MTDDAKCQICGELMPPGETMFNFHGYSGPCPKPPLPSLVSKQFPASTLAEVMPTRADELSHIAKPPLQPPPTPPADARDFLTRFIHDYGLDATSEYFEGKVSELTALIAGAGRTTGPDLRNPIVHATVRDAEDELHVECRFADGQKYAGVIIPKSNDGEDTDEERLAHWLARAILAHPRPTGEAGGGDDGEEPQPDTCHECGELAVGFDHDTSAMLCAKCYRRKPSPGIN